MSERITLKQWAEFCGKAMYALPRDMDPATAQGWTDDCFHDCWRWLVEVK